MTFQYENDFLEDAAYEEASYRHTCNQNIDFIYIHEKHQYSYTAFDYSVY